MVSRKGMKEQLVHGADHLGNVGVLSGCGLWRHFSKFQNIIDLICPQNVFADSAFQLSESQLSLACHRVTRLLR